MYYECELLCALGFKQQAWRDVVEGLGKKRDMPPLIRKSCPEFLCFLLFLLLFRCNSAESEPQPSLG